MENITNTITNQILDSKLITSVIIFITSYLIYKLIRWTVEKRLKSKKYTGKKLTYIKLFDSVLKYFFMVVTVLIIIQVYGVNITSLVAGLGIVSIIVGLAVQDLIKDVIAGFDIITDNIFSVGDVIKVSGLEGKVISFGLKNTKIQELGTNNICMFSNGDLQNVINVSDWNDVIVPCPYETKKELIDCVLSEVTEEIKTFDKVTACEYLGLSNFADSCLEYKLRFHCHPTNRPVIRRKVLSCIKLAFDNNNISIPYPQLDVNVKK